MRTTLFAATLFCGCIGSSLNAADPNVLTEDEKRAGFELLFNGQDLRGWEPETDSWKLADGPWKVQNGAIFLPAADTSPGPDLIYTGKLIPVDFDLRFQWKEAPPGSPYLEGQFAIGTGHGETTEGQWTGRFSCSYCAGDRFIELLTDEVTVPAKWTGFRSSQAPGKDVRRPAGQWNEARMVCKGAVFEHWLNGQKILAFDLRREYWARSKESREPLLNQWLKVKDRGFCLRLDTLGAAAWYRGLKVCAISQ